MQRRRFWPRRSSLGRRPVGNDDGNGNGSNTANTNVSNDPSATEGPIDIQFGSGADPNAEFMAKLTKKTGETWEDNR